MHHVKLYVGECQIWEMKMKCHSHSLCLCVRIWIWPIWLRCGPFCWWNSIRDAINAEKYNLKILMHLIAAAVSTHSHTCVCVCCLHTCASCIVWKIDSVARSFSELWVMTHIPTINIRSPQYIWPLRDFFKAEISHDFFLRLFLSVSNFLGSNHDGVYEMCVGYIYVCAFGIQTIQIKKENSLPKQMWFFYVTEALTMISTWCIYICKINAIPKKIHVINSFIIDFTFSNVSLPVSSRFFCFVFE